MSTPTKERAEQLANMVEKRRQAIESMLMDIKEQRGEDAQLEPGEQARYRQMTEDLRSLQDHAETYAEDLARVGTLPTKLAHSGGADAHARSWAANTATELRRAFGAESRAVISGSVDVPQLIPEYVTAIPHPVRLIDLFPSRLAIDSMAYEYFRQTKRTNNAAPVPDNALKPTSILTVQAITDRARVIAHLSEPLPFRISLDMDAITSWLYAEMSAGVLDATEFQAINGDGTGENCEGVLHVPGTTAVPFAADMVTTLRAAITSLQTLGEVPTGWALSPADAEAIDLVRWGSAGGFLSGGFEHDNRDGFGTSDNIFGTVPRVVSPSVPTGTAILGDWTQLKLFIREQMRIDLDASGVLFQQNQIQLRAESRVGVGILRPQAFAICDLTAGTTTKSTAKK